jgi:hypothetical protein
MEFKYNKDEFGPVSIKEHKHGIKSIIINTKEKWTSFNRISGRDKKGDYIGVCVESETDDMYEYHGEEVKYYEEGINDYRVMVEQCKDQIVLILIPWDVFKPIKKNTCGSTE